MKSNSSLTERFLVQIPLAKYYKYIPKMSFTERVFRTAPRCAAWIDQDSFIIAGAGKVYRVEISKEQIYEEFAFPAGMRAPLYFSRVTDLLGFTDGIYCGTYSETCKNVQIWSRNLEGLWKKEFTFAQGSVLHVHNILPDSLRSRLLIFTGDSNRQVGIWDVKNGFYEVQKIAGEEQKYRACFAFIDNDHLIFATDAPGEQNYLFDMDCETGYIVEICKLSGPVVNGTQLHFNGKLQYLFSTVVEPDNQLTGWEYFLSRRRAKGVLTDQVHVFLGSREEGFQEIASLKKDALPMGLFQFGNIYFPEGMNNKIFICPQATRYSGQTLEVLL